MRIAIPGRTPVELKNVVFDYNGTIAIDGRLIEGVSENIRELSNQFNFYVITADTFGSVERELDNTECQIITIPEADQDQSKLKIIMDLGAQNSLAAGNGRNDKLMLKNAAIGVGILQSEGICTETLFESDLVLPSILDVFAFLKNPKRLIATLRN